MEFVRRRSRTRAHLSTVWHRLDQKEQLFESASSTKRNYSCQMTPGAAASRRLQSSFWFSKSSVVIFHAVCARALLNYPTALVLCVNTTYILLLGTQGRRWLTRLRWQRRDALRLASTQLGPMHPQGECWESEVEGQGHKPGINSVKWTASTVDKESLRARRRKRGKTQTENRLLETSNGKLETMLWEAACEWAARQHQAAEEWASNTCQQNMSSKLL